MSSATIKLDTSQKNFRSGYRNENFFGAKVGGKFVFNTKLLLMGVSEAEAKALSMGGFYVMDTARKSIRSPGKKGDPAKAGSPPKSRLGYLKDFIDYQFEPREHRTVVGPRGLQRPASRLIAPGALERGGQTIAWIPEGTIWHGKANRPMFGAQARVVAKVMNSFKAEDVQTVLDEEYKYLTRGRKISMTIAAHPYMTPAFRRNEKKIAQLWKNAL